MKDDKLASLLKPFANPPDDPHYLAYFDCFNRGLFFEAHEVLERIWLPERGKPKDLFYKGLIQLAGAFVHLDKNRAAPASALLRLARTNLQPFAPLYESLDVAELLEFIDGALRRLKGGPLGPGIILPPRLALARPARAGGACAKPVDEQLSCR